MNITDERLLDALDDSRRALDETKAQKNAALIRASNAEDTAAQLRRELDAERLAHTETRRLHKEESARRQAALAMHDRVAGDLIRTTDGLRLMALERDEAYETARRNDERIAALVAGAEKMRTALRDLADASEDMASSDADMPSHDATEYRFDIALAAARARLATQRGT